MSSVSYPPPYVAAAVQTAPAFLQPQATAERAASLVAEAARNGASLVAFPEVFIAGYPYWNWIMTPLAGSEWFRRLHDTAVTVPGPEVAIVAAAARRCGAHVVIGVNERSRRGVGTVYNTMLSIDDRGRLIGRHRKLVPTWAEKLTWTGGDGSSLVVHDTTLGPLGVMACGENSNPLARFALLELGELVHVTGYIALPTAPDDYDMAAAIALRTAAHSFEGKVFTVASCSTISDEIIAAMAPAGPEFQELLRRRNAAWSGVCGPDGVVIGDPLIDDEGIAYAEIDVTLCVEHNQMHNVTGHYNRFDVFSFAVDRTPRGPDGPFDGPIELLGTEPATSGGEEVRDEHSHC